MELADQYHHAFNEYVKSNKVILFLESTGETRKESSNTIDFMKSLEMLEPSSNLEMIFTEKEASFVTRSMCIYGSSSRRLMKLKNQ